MAHDGQTAMTTQAILIAELHELTRSAIPAVEEVLDMSVACLRSLVTFDGRVSSAAIEAHQTAAHGVAWLATYVEALRQMRAWADRLEVEGKFGEMEALILQIGFGEYLWQIHGGIPMSQGEMLRLQDIGLSQEDLRALMVPAVMRLTQDGNTQAARTRLVELIQEQDANTTFGASGLDDEIH